MRLSLTVGALLASSAVAFVPPMPASRTRATKLVRTPPFFLPFFVYRVVCV